MFDFVIVDVQICDGTGQALRPGHVAVDGDRIARLLAPGEPFEATAVIEGGGQVLAPGFIDVHAHDDQVVVDAPEMTPKVSQGVTTVIVGNCGLSAAPLALDGPLPEPLNLLGPAAGFRYPTFAAYARVVGEARPAVNVAALVGHTSLRAAHLSRLDRAATQDEIAAMARSLVQALEEGALGLSTGLSYASASAAPTAEVSELAAALARAGALYVTHLRSESTEIFSALSEAFAIGRNAPAPVVVSHLKCAGTATQGKSREVLAAVDAARSDHDVSFDCYPYSASSSTLDLAQVDDGVEILITWSEPHPEVGGRSLADVAREWGVTRVEAAERLLPAGAVYHCMTDEDVERFLRHPASMIGSDGLPCDPRPHPRLWGTFPRVLGHYARERRLLSVPVAVHKMTGLPAARFGLGDRGVIREGAFADLVLFDPARVRDTATFADPIRTAEGIAAVWVNGVLTWQAAGATGRRGGRFLLRNQEFS